MMRLIFFLLFSFCAFNIYSDDSFDNEPINEDSYSQEVIPSDEILAKKVTSLIFTNESELIAEECLQDYEGIELEGLDCKYLPDLKRHFDCFLNRPLTLSSLYEIKKESLEYFKKNTPYLVDVKILEKQDISNGKIQIFVQFARVAEITARGAKYFSNCRIANNLKIPHEDYLNVEKVRKYTSFLNKNPFRQVSVMLDPGEDIGTTNIHFYTEDIFPLKVFAGYENTGNAIAGQSRFLTGLNFGNFLFLDHQLNIEFKTSPSVSKWWGIAGDYIIPTFLNTYLKFIGSYVKTKPKTEQDFHLRGKSWATLLRYHIPIEIFKTGINEIIFGYDFKETNNFLTFSGDSIYDNYIDVSQFVFQFMGRLYDKLGITSYLFSMYFSPGDMTKHNDDRDFQIEGYARKSKYTYFTLHFDRTFNLPKEFMYVLDFFAQVSTRKLLPTEQISLGGYSTIRGHQENEAYGDQGFYIRNEARSPKIYFKKLRNIEHELQFLAFLDVGYVSDLNTNIFSRNATSLWSIGPGLRYTAEDNVIIKLDYGIQLKNVDREFFNKSWHTKLHAFVSFQY